MADVIVLSDTSDASSDCEMAPASASSTPAASPAVPRKPAQSVGYSNAVEAALAMAAAFETQTPKKKKKEEKEKKQRTKPAPPLLSTKSKKSHATHQQLVPAARRQTVSKPVEKHRRATDSQRGKHREKQPPAKSHRTRARSSSSSSSSSSSLESDSSSESRRRGRADVLRRQSSKAAGKGKCPLKRRRRPNDTSNQRRMDERQKARARSQVPAAKPKSVEVVDLLSSSSSSSSSSSLSDSSVGDRTRSFSFSSLTSSGDDSPSLAVNAGKKRLVLNDRVLGKSQASAHFARTNSATSRPRFSSQRDRKVTDKVVVTLPEGKRKRVLPHMRRKSAGGNQKRGRIPEDELEKKTVKSKKPMTNGVLHRDSAAKTALATPSSPLSISSSSTSTPSSPASLAASSPKLLPSPDSLPRQLTSRKSAATLSTATTAHVRDGETNAFGRYQCRKSAPASATSSRRADSPSPPPTASANRLPSPSSSPSPRKKRRVTASTFFDMDRVALDDLQAQERELAWIRLHRKQTQAHPPKPAAPKRKTTEVISIDEHSDTNSTVYSEEFQQDDRHLGGANMKPKLSVAVKPPSADASCTALLHPTSYRGVYLREAPPNILPLPSLPFDTRCDHPLTYYDETDTLASQCVILENFGKPTQCISSVFPSEVAKPQSEVTRAVGALVAAHLPVIRSCHKRKVQAILVEARQKISAYRTAMKKHRQILRQQKVTSHVLQRTAAEKNAVRKLKITQHSCSMDTGSVSFQIGRGDGFLREKTVSSLIQINRVESIEPMRRYTTSVGVRANYRVEDDPILRYTAITRPSSGSGGDDAAKKYALRIGNVADEEVIEYVLRLVVGRLGDSEQVFQALKTELDFSQAYTAYSELKKLLDSRQRAKARIDRIEELSHDGVQVAEPEVAAIVNLMEQSSLLKRSRGKVLSRRLQPPTRHLESNFIDSLVNGAATGLAALGLRTTDSYAELVDVYCGSFCRMCYKYACHEHSGDHPLPARRVDPVYPQIRSAASAAPLCKRGDEANSLDLLEDEVVCLGSEPNGKSEILCGESSVCSNVGCGASSHTVTAQDIGIVVEGKYQLQKRTVIADPSEFVDDSHLSLVATKMRLFLSKSSDCGRLCWKSSDRFQVNNKRASLSAAELGLVRKLRETLGDNSCLLAAVVGSASCIDMHELIMKEKANDQRAMTDGRSSRRMRSWKHGRRSGGSNHELLQRTRNQRLQDRGTENHEYKPCMHDGMCDSTGCSCMKRDHMCEKACACSRDCPNRFEGCTCRDGECRTDKCPCFAALRECDPDVCVSCGACDLAVDMVKGASIASMLTCSNVNVIRNKHKRLGMSFSSIHGYGMYAREAISANEFVYEYTGAMLSQDEAERRGLIYDKMEMSYLFDLNEDAVLDALRCGNKSKFINHDGEAPNCTAKVVSVCGVHHITKRRSRLESAQSSIEGYRLRCVLAFVRRLSPLFKASLLLVQRVF
ncbi:hypothetical protein PF001_g4791 [Phytophthora fragariae]|uniref:CXC domain-containing protein n=1 Tax=Phytophthora fragariae TaxID=53985 RepID=A0A6A3FIG9_9STRA|nr:hypothetical protein PF009_g5409 [Phytophthora fragariae]KAE9150934.1 hypothetical protein PF006_g4726 [Phytophthora fragariae]KAE9321683.1 hypothetical protein PF001_g4791 [Phytophthora fragariae]